MDFTNLYNKQRELDHYIETKHGLQEKDLLNQKLLAFHVEVAELANETRCFKFWSEKAPSSDSVILEEYVDGIHFILSVGLEFGYENIVSIDLLPENKKSGEDLVPYFYDVIEAVSSLRLNGAEKKYITLFQSYLKLGSALGFTEQDIIFAYEEKNKVNHTRQDQGY
ncbi:dUTP diphosphatase [Evansella sp. AB-P1]|uniref:dUTP diphosphatase n=1 Tax=Evansella sp. AB-P1 TaxID=3037653 RepID=UPI00241F18B6|nr:dUTP diphosphatase [Evansella sp. AB-P1]MDG5786945.1 dUTP diphosphatase [Evansella sp. AB-P1]